MGYEVQKKRGGGGLSGGMAVVSSDCFAAYREFLGMVRSGGYDLRGDAITFGGWFGRTVDSVADSGPLLVSSGVGDEPLLRVFPVTQNHGVEFSEGGCGSAAVSEVGGVSGGEYVSVVQEDCGVDPVRGRHWKKNQKKSRNRKSKLDLLGSDWRKKADSVQGNVEEKSVLRLSLEAKWQVENELKVAKAKRELELLSQQSVEAVAKLQQKKLQAALDKTMVQIEKSHATLASTGNVPGFVPEGGYCKTVLTDEPVPVLSEGCTISPDSSASMHEYNLAMKRNAQLELEVAQLKKAAKFSSYREKGAITLTCNSDGGLSEACEQALKDNLRPGFMEHSRDYEIAKRNGVRIRQVYDESYDDSYDY